jgi:hypothetical protein
VGVLTPEATPLMAVAGWVGCGSTPWQVWGLQHSGGAGGAVARRRMPTAAEVEALEQRAAAAEAESGRLLAALDEARSGAASAVNSGGGIAGVLMEVRRCPHCSCRNTAAAQETGDSRVTRCGRLSTEKGVKCR